MDIRSFKNISSGYAPSVVWDWCAKPTPEQIDAGLFKFSQMGIGSVYIRPSKGLVLPYLSEDYFELIRTCARRASRYGLTLWIFDENSSSSGNGGGEITSVADYRMCDIIQTVKEKTEKTDTIVSENDNSVIVLRDMSRLRASGRFPVADITDSFAVKCYAETVYDKYISSCSRFIGHEIHGFITCISFPDADLYSETAVKKLGDFSTAVFSQKLCENQDGIKEKYNRAFSKAVCENYTLAIKEKCKENNLMLSVCTDMTKGSRQLHYVKSDVISFRFDSQNPDFYSFKLAESISSQFEKQLTVHLLLPSFAPCSQRFNKAAFAVSLGAGNICYESASFSLSDRRKYEDNTVILSEFSESDISARINRLSSVTSQTTMLTDALIITSSESTDYFKSLCEILLKKGIGFHIAEEDIVSEYATFNEKSINIGKNAYTTVICEKSIQHLLGSFGGKIITPDTTLPAEEFDTTDFSASLSINADKEIYINRRTDENDEYIFVTATCGDTVIEAECSDKKLFVTDSSNGEIYELPIIDDKYRFTLKSGKTVLLVHSSQISADMMIPFTDDIELEPHIKEADIPFILSSAEENILPLKNVNACFGRKSYRESNIDDLHREFYALNDKETVKVKYPFMVDRDKIGRVRAYIENASNLDFVELNGSPISEFEPSLKDPVFMGIDITDLLADGKNTFALEYKKSNNYMPDFSSITPPHYYSYNMTSFEPVYLCGDFDVVDSRLTFSDGYSNDVALSGMPFYYGSLSYEASLPESDLSGKFLKVCGSFDICRIKVGKREFTYYSEEPMLELFNLDGGMVAEITIFNTAYNLFRNQKSQPRSFGIEEIVLTSPQSI